MILTSLSRPGRGRRTSVQYSEDVETNADRYDPAVPRVAAAPGVPPCLHRRSRPPRRRRSAAAAARPAPRRPRWSADGRRGPTPAHSLAAAPPAARPTSSRAAAPSRRARVSRSIERSGASVSRPSVRPARLWMPDTAWRRPASSFCPHRSSAPCRRATTFGSAMISRTPRSCTRSRELAQHGGQVRQPTLDAAERRSALVQQVRQREHQPLRAVVQPLPRAAEQRRQVGQATFRARQAQPALLGQPVQRRRSAAPPCAPGRRPDRRAPAPPVRPPRSASARGGRRRNRSAWCRSRARPRRSAGCGRRRRRG